MLKRQAAVVETVARAYAKIIDQSGNMTRAQLVQALVPAGTSTGASR